MPKIIKRNRFIAVVIAAIVLMTVIGLHATALARETGTNGSITAEQAKDIVLEKVPSATIHDFELDKEHGKDIYEVETISGGYEYEFDIDVASGEILQLEKEPVIYNDGDDLYDDDDDGDDLDGYDDDDDDDDGDDD